MKPEPLPSSDRVIIDPRKLRDYVLSVNHPLGRYKAEFFSRQGFSAAQWQEFADALRQLVLNNHARQTEVTEYGKKYTVTGPVRGPSGKTAKVVSVWIILNTETRPRLVTVYPEKQS